MKSGGSSPLTRGARQHSQEDVPRLGLIPAHAGSTLHKALRYYESRAHPRSRGEHWSSAAALMPSSGSSPLTRGAPFLDAEAGAVDGLIPAHAGSTQDGCAGIWCGPAHPRSRGEHRAGWEFVDQYVGSSPLTRGAPAGCCRLHRRRGLIPAHAGSTIATGSATSSRRAHPRSRGEHRWKCPRRTSASGSSPLTRGARDLLIKKAGECGLIPAHAGSTAFRVRARRALRAHPRSRGEHLFAALVSEVPAGSSPLTRGAHWKPYKPKAGRGLIPAHAGSTRA